MNNKIGENIYKLRKQRNYTQQHLSEIIGVSTAAISKWETGSAYPDIELLPKIASIFDVSIDYFFDYLVNSSDNSTIIIDKASHLCETRQYSEAISMLSEVLLRYPNNVTLKFKRAEIMIYSGVTQILDSEKIRILTKANCELKEVINSSESRQMIDESYYLLGMSYINLKDFDKALESINQFRQSNHINSGIALLQLYLENGDINNAKRQFELNVFFSIVHIHINTLWIDQVFHDDLEKSILFYEMAIGAIKAYSGNNSCRFDVIISEFYERAASAYIKINNCDKAIDSLKLAVEYAFSYDNLKIENDLPQFDRLDANDTSWDIIVNQKLRLLDKIQSNTNKDYKILSNTCEFKELIKDLRNS